MRCHPINSVKKGWTDRGNRGESHQTIWIKARGRWIRVRKVSESSPWERASEVCSEEKIDTESLEERKGGKEKKRSVLNPTTSVESGKLSPRVQDLEKSRSEGQQKRGENPGSQGGATEGNTEI